MLPIHYDNINMELSDKDIEQLTKYWEGKLSQKEKDQISTRMNEDQAYAKAAQKSQLLTTSLELIRMRKRRQQLLDFDSTLAPVKAPSVTTASNNWLKIGAIALLISLLTFGAWYAFQKKTSPSISEPIASHFEPYPTLGLTMGDTPDERKKEALTLYAQKKYMEAIPLLQDSFLETQDSMLLFYKAIAHLAVGHNQEALLIFEQLQQVERVPQEATQWYLALAYVATNQKDKAIQLLTKNRNSSYQTKIEQLLRELEG